MDQKEALNYVRGMMGDQFKVPKGVEIPVTIKPAGNGLIKLVGLAALAAVAVYAGPALSSLSAIKIKKPSGADGRSNWSESDFKTDTAKMNAEVAIREAGNRVQNGGGSDTGDSTLLDQLRDHFQILEDSGASSQDYQTIADSAKGLGQGGESSANMW